MKKFYASFLLGCMIVVAGCEDSPNQASTAALTTDFLLLDPTGAHTTTFRIGEDIHLRYSINNETGEQQDYFIPDTGPFVSFEILRTGVPLGSSEDGISHAPTVVADSVAANQSVTRDYHWYSNASHQVLPAGAYTARATPRLQFENLMAPAFQDISFTITENANIQVSDSSSLVIITDQPPPDLQRDDFSLNSVSVSGDTISLNLSYSGGCLEHDFVLFMSPGSFLESFPVQASLYLWHDGKDDPCDAIITVDVSFNLRPIAELHQFFYGSNDEIILNVYDYFISQPNTKLSTSYFPQ